MRFLSCFIAVFICIDAAYAQTGRGFYDDNYNDSVYNRLAKEEIKQMHGYLRNSGDQKTARNILILKAVADYKIGDEKLEKEFENLESNREYHERLNKIMDKLNNKKIRNSKNRDVINILNDAGNKLYNLLAN